MRKHWYLIAICVLVEIVILLIPTSYSIKYNYGILIISFKIFWGLTKAIDKLILKRKKDSWLLVIAILLVCFNFFLPFNQKRKLLKDDVVVGFAKINNLYEAGGRSTKGYMVSYIYQVGKAKYHFQDEVDYLGWWNLKNVDYVKIKYSKKEPGISRIHESNLIPIPKTDDIIIISKAIEDSLLNRSN